jgi:hypothetical protein
VTEKSDCETPDSSEHLFLVTWEETTASFDSLQVLISAVTAVFPAIKPRKLRWAGLVARKMEIPTEF